VMSKQKPLPLFSGVIKKVAKYKDTATVKVIVQVREMAINGGGIEDLEPLETWTHVCFRLQGDHLVLDKLGSETTREYQEKGYIKQNEEISFTPGRTIYFCGVGPAVWDGKSTFEDKPLQTMIKVIEETISGRASTAIDYLKLKNNVAKGVGAATDEAEITEVINVDELVAVS